MNIHERERVIRTCGRYFKNQGLWQSVHALRAMALQLMLYAEGPMTLSEICRQLNLSEGQVFPPIRRLKREGYLASPRTKKPKPMDERTFGITPKGRRDLYECFQEASLDPPKVWRV
jgi:DNA-binding PadR family transcriptional regulator